MRVYSAACLALTCLFYNSSAGARLNHGGGHCVKIGSGGNLVRYWQGTVGNDHWSQELWLLCPAVRRAGENTTGGPIFCGIDRSSTAGIRCSFYDQRSYGHAWWWSGWKETSGASANNYASRSWSATNSQDKFDGFHHFFCKIPPRSSIGISVLSSYAAGE